MKILSLLLFAVSTVLHAQAPVAAHNIVYYHENEFAAWPANEGLWSWGDEILVGFNVAGFKERNDTHSISGDMGVAFARSLDGGKTWSVERHQNVLPPAKLASPSRHQASPGGIDFTHPDFAMKLRGRFFFTSTDRGHTWQGAYRVPDFGQDMDARTSYIVTGKSACLFFIPCSVNDGRCARIRSCAVETTDGGKSFHFLSWIGPDPLESSRKKLSFDTKHVTSTMPSVVRMDDGRLVCAMRNRVDRVKWTAIEESTDGGHTWHSVTTLEKGSSNPVSLVRLGGTRIAALYGNRRTLPCRLSAKLSDDGGRTWGAEITLRDDGRKWDLGYTRASLRPDGSIVILYYFSTEAVPQQHIEATIWRP